MSGVLHINVRLSEGGAAKVALDLHQRLNSTSSFNSYLAYGYGHRAKKSPKEPELNAFQIGSRSHVLTNFLSYKLLNKDVTTLNNTEKNDFESLLDKVEFVHLHVIHSYFINYEWLIDLLIKKDKKIVWTFHDLWALTGRCALPDGCTNWKHSCGSCKTLDNYPPVWLDQSASNFNNKRAYLLKLIEYGCKFVAPSFHLAYQVENVIKNLKMTVIQNGLDLDSEKVILNFSSVKERAKVQHDKVKIMVIAHDLAYAGKTNHPLIYKLMKELNIQLHTVGKNSPFEGDDVINHGYISSKINLFNIYIEMDLMLFTSQVDNFPLVIGESLCIGLPVIATGSKASSEVLALIGAKPTADESQLLDIIKNKSWLKELYNGDSLDTIKDKAKIEFSGERVLNDYKKLYRSS